VSSISVLPRELEGALDGLIERFGQPAEAVAAARVLYAERTGRVYEEDEIYEARTVAFLEWFVLEHGEPPPVLRALAEERDALLGAALWALSTAHRSLFSVEALEPGKVVLDDLWGGARFEVDERRRLHGVSPGDVVEARLVGWRGRVRFGRTFSFHPSAARTAITGHLARIRREGGTRADAVDFVATLQVKALRWKHVDIAKVYG